tara:strand:+ start:1112 stop:1609 length:498 start_codon:yes stop_codon:yes gene_type:complete
MIKKIATLAFLMSATSALAVDSPIGGVVQPKCSVWTDVSGVYGHPLPYKLSTLPADGGVKASIRYDIAQADYYKARITHPNSFSSSPSLSDAVAWTGSSIVGQVSVAAMSAYEAAKVTYNNVTEFNMTLAGSTWFTVSSTAQYGNTKSLPAGSYTAMIKAECIAK